MQEAQKNDHLKTFNRYKQFFKLFIILFIESHYICNI